MRTIENKLAKMNEKVNITYGELIMNCVKAQNIIQGQPQPLNYDMLKKIAKVDSVIGENKLKKSFDFEDSEYDFIKEKVKAMPWGFYSKEFITFTDYIDNIQPNKKK